MALTDKQHYGPEDLLAFLERRINNKRREEQMESHLVSCFECAELLGQVAETALLVDQWNAQSHADLELAVLASRAITAGGELPEFSKWRDRLRKWVQAGAAKVQGAIGVSVSAGRSTLFPQPVPK